LVANRPRVVIAVPSIVEGKTLAEWLAADGFEPVQRPTFSAAADEIQARTFDLLIVDAAFAFLDGLIGPCRVRDPHTPRVVIGDAIVAARCQAMGRRVMYLARPVERSMLLCTVSMAMLNEERPLRCSERKPVNRFEAVANGVPSYIIDVSHEGLRLEMTRNRRTVPPPFFTVRVPLIGGAITVRRVWARTLSDKGRTGVTFCGGAISQNQAKAEQAWRVFVDTVFVLGRPVLDSVQLQ
jgi:DNA-binding response OmpR family regulator